jgi:hypothetical protein
MIDPLYQLNLKPAHEVALMVAEEIDPADGAWNGYKLAILARVIHDARYEASTAERVAVLAELQGIASAADGLYDAETGTLIRDLPAHVAKLGIKL